MAIIKLAEKAEAPKLTERIFADVLASKFAYFRNRVFPNVFICGGEMDVAVVTPAGYLWEIEIKLTLSDWRNDANKSKWRHPGRKFVSKFYYAVPLKMIEKAPEFVPEDTGLLGIYWHEYLGWSIKEHRPAKGRGEKITAIMRQKLMLKAYYKLWHERLG